jgi:hypothetical protein
MTNKPTLISVLLILGILYGCQTESSRDPLVLNGEIERGLAANSLSRKESRKGWVLLFDGTQPDQWRGYNMQGFPDCWTIEDGSLTMTTKGGGEDQDIITLDPYREFAFSVEYKLTRGANSGILFQVSESPKYKFPYETGPEFQVIDHENWPDKLEDWQINGANYAMYHPLVRPYKALGEWNHALLVVDGDKVTQILNDQIVVQYTKNTDEWMKLRNSGKWSGFPDWGLFDSGHISLQNHGTKVWYRNIKIKELKPQ